MAKPKRGTLPPLPASVWSALGPIPVRVVPDLKDEKGEALLGCWEQATREISVRAGIDPKAALATVIHEWIHAMLDDAGVRMSPDLEEQVCDSLATAIAADVLSHRR